MCRSTPARAVACPSKVVWGGTVLAALFPFIICGVFFNEMSMVGMCTFAIKGCELITF